MQASETKHCTDKMWDLHWSHQRQRVYKKPLKTLWPHCKANSKSLKTKLNQIWMSSRIALQFGQEEILQIDKILNWLRYKRADTLSLWRQQQSKTWHSVTIKHSYTQCVKRYCKLPKSKIIIYERILWHKQQNTMKVIHGSLVTSKWYKIDPCKTLGVPYPNIWIGLTFDLDWPDYEYGSSTHQGLSTYQVWSF